MLPQSVDAPMEETQQSDQHLSPRLNGPTCHIINLSVKPPPWSLKGEAWWIILSILGPARNRVTPPRRRPEKMWEDLESANSDIFEKPSDEVIKPTGTLRGGFGSVQLVRYHMSPVGAYDELLIIPGAFAPPKELANSLSSSAFRITRIYVSTLSSVLNGRHNWNIPKHLARFEFTRVKDSPHKLLVKVFSLKSFSFTPASSKRSWTFEPEFFDTPCFSVIIHRHFPGLNVPVNLAKVPLLDLTLIQPPLVPVEPSEPNNAHLNCGLIGTTDWKKTKLEIKGRCGLCSFKGDLPGRRGQLGDGKLFPDVEPYRFGFHFPSIDLKVLPATSLLVKTS